MFVIKDHIFVIEIQENQLVYNFKLSDTYVIPYHCKIYRSNFSSIDYLDENRKVIGCDDGDGKFRSNLLSGKINYKKGSGKILLEPYLNNKYNQIVLYYGVDEEIQQCKYKTKEELKKEMKYHKKQLKQLKQLKKELNILDIKI